MRVTVLGASAARPNPHGACTGLLLDAAGARFLIDCGSGALERLLRHARPSELAAGFLTHAHPDHCLDLVNLRQALAYSPETLRTEPLPIHAPAEAIATMHALGEVFGDASFWDGWIDWRPVQAGSTIELDGLKVRFHRTRHYLECLAMRFEAEGRSFVFTADGGPDPELTGFARQAGLLLTEATLLERRGHEEAWGHMSAAEAGQLAEAAGAERLVLTHCFHSLGIERLLGRARAACTVPVDLAREGEVHDV